MNCRNIVKCYFSIFVALSFSLTPQPKVFAQSNSIGCEAKEYELSNIELTDTPRLTASDIINDSDFVEQIANQEQTLPTNSPYKSSATKDVARYWQMRVKNSDLLSINGSDVKYTLISSNETNNPFKENQVELKVFGDIEQIETCTDDTTIIAGGVSLEFFELSKLVPGTFRGEINICVPVNGNQCQ